MCGRAYRTYTDEELAIRYLNKKPIRLEFETSYNFCPTQLSPVVLIREDEIKVELMRWGLVPSWAKSVKDAEKYSLINARGEEIEQKRSFKSAFFNRRCIVPFSGFFEWRSPKKGPKVPFALHLKSDPIMSIAGIWEEWTSKETGELVLSFAIVTTAANKFVGQIHDRMPVILSKEQEELWLNPKLKDEKTLKDILNSCPDTWLEMFEVATSVNSPRHNSAANLVPVKQASNN